MVLPASTIMYASGQSTDNSDSSSSGSTSSDNNAADSGSSSGGGGTTTTDNSGSSSTGGSTDNSATLPTTSTASNNTGNADASQENNNTVCDKVVSQAGRTLTCANGVKLTMIGNGHGGYSTVPFQETNNTLSTADLANIILAVHNSERAAVGVLPLVWSDELAAGAKAWAEEIAPLGFLLHDASRPDGAGENIASFIASNGPRQGQSLWVDEKKNWHGGVLTPENWSATGHYTQMVWKDTTKVGCRTGSYVGKTFSVLVCRYSPPGNFMGQAPY
jgi:uncharacterized protein YkwD